MPNVPDPNIQRLDLRTAITFLALMGTVAGSAVAIARFAWLSDIDRIVSVHTLERSEWRSDINARISRIEEQCRENREWRERLQRDIDGLHQWRSNCSVKQQELSSRIADHDRQDDAVINALNRRQDWLEKQLNLRPGP